MTWKKMGSGGLALLLLLSVAGCNPATNPKNEVSVGPLENKLGLDMEGEHNYHTFSVDYENGEHYDVSHEKCNLPNLETPLYFNYGQTGKDRKVALTLFYDFRQIPFRVGESGSFSKVYTFDIADQSQVKLPIYLDPTIPVDDQPHKLIYSFVDGADQHMVDISEFAEPYYGLFGSIDLGFTDTQEYDFSKEARAPKEANQYLDYVSEILINQDFSGKNRNASKTPSSLIEAKAGSQVDVMAFLGFTGENTDYNDQIGTVLLTCGFLQIPINDDLSPSYYVKNGKSGAVHFSFTAPTQPGDYELIAYLVGDSTAKTIRCNVHAGPRITLRVTE